MSLPPLFTCELCSLEIDPKSGNSIRLAKVWLKSNGRTVAEIEDEMYRYRHSFCKDESGHKQESLF